MALLRAVLDPGAVVLTPSAGTTAAITNAGFRHEVHALAEIPAGSAAAIALCDGELAAAGARAEVLIDAAAVALAPGGILLASVPGRIHRVATAAPDPDDPGPDALGEGRAFTAAELLGVLEHRGFRVHRLRGRGVDDDALADAAETLDTVARAPTSKSDRSTVFFSTLPTKLVAASVLCRDEQGRLLVVHDRFRGHWTIPGGVVDQDEDPRSAARRETWEEAGVRVDVGRLLTAFHALWPDRLHLIYDALPLNPEVEPDPVHVHEVSAAEWLDLDAALARLAPHMAARVRTALDS